VPQLTLRVSFALRCHLGVVRILVVGPCLPLCRYFDEFLLSLANMATRTG